MARQRVPALVAALAMLSGGATARGERPGVPVITRESRTARVAIEVLDDELVHFEMSRKPSAGTSIPTTPMVLRRPHDGPTRFATRGAHGFATSTLRVRVDAALCVHVTDLSHRPAARLTVLCPETIDRDRNVLTIAAGTSEGLYGLGEHFGAAGQANGDLTGRVISPGTEVGNAVTSFDGGATGNAQFPVLYAIGHAGRGYALFVDQLEAQTWDLTADPWRVTMAGAAIRGYLIAGDEPLALRRRFMALVGRPPVPPKKMFGLWGSEFGFAGRAGLEDKLRARRANHVPTRG